MDFLYLIFCAYLRLLFLDVETNSGPGRPVPDVCRILCSNVWGLVENLNDLTYLLRLSMKYCCAQTLVSDMHHVSDLPHGSRIRSPRPVVPRQDASGQRDGGIRTKLLRSISPTQI